jgi:glycosyltransferase involved in cell wall biosynthesis
LYSAKSLRNLLSSIWKSDLTGLDLQVIVVNNLEKYESSSKLASFSGSSIDFKYLSSNTLGVNKARNLGVRYASGDIIWFLDDDCVIEDPNIFLKLKQLFEEHPSAHGIGGFYKSGSCAGAANFYQEETHSWLESARLDYKRVSRTVQLVGGNACYRRCVFEEGFLFDPQITFGGAEEGFNLRLHSAGKELYITHKLDVGHNFDLSTWGLMKKKFRQGVGHTLNKELWDQAAFDDYVGKRHRAPIGHKFYQSLSDVSFNLGRDWGQYQMNRTSVFELLLGGVKTLLSYLNLDHYFVTATQFLYHKIYRPIFTVAILAPYYWLRHKVFSRLWIFGQLYHVIKKAITFLYVHLMIKPFHFIKKRVWYPKKLFHALKILFSWLWVNLLLHPTHFVKANIWKTRKIYDFVMVHYWKLVYPFHFFYHKVIKKLHYYMVCGYYKIALKPYYVLRYNYRTYLKPVKPRKRN